MVADQASERAISVLDKGHVRLRGVLRYFDSDEHEVAVVNAARASFEREVTTLGPSDLRILDYLVRHAENSPFRHAFLQFQVKAPLMVARQWWKYAVGSAHLVDDDATAWNERTLRAANAEPEFYVPGEWRSGSPYDKQGSGGPVEKKTQERTSWLLNHLQGEGLSLYQDAIRRGVSAEQARLFLPAYGLYVSWVWSASLLAVLWFLHQRLGERSQHEMRLYARAVDDLARPLYPHSFGLLGVT